MDENGVKRYDEQVLGCLLDKYENSLLYTEKNQVQIRIVYPVKKSTLPEYFDEASLQFTVIHEQLEALEQKGMIRLVWKNGKRGHILEKCVLVTEHAEDACHYLNRRSRKKKENVLEAICTKYEGKAPELDNFLLWVRTRLSEGESIRKYVDMDQPEEFAGLCELVWRILNNRQECFLRQFSICWFHDSKQAENEIRRAVRIIARFGTDKRLGELSVDEALEEYMIYSNPPVIQMKGQARFWIKGSAETKETHDVSGQREVCALEENDGELLDLSVFADGIGVSGRDAKRLIWSRNMYPSMVVTVENLTSFYQWNRQDVLCIYLGGYANRVKREFLKRLYAFYPRASYYHFGDIDCGGFQIWKNLCIGTGIPFAALYMDEGTYLRYLAYGRNLSAQDRRTLASMQEDPFFAGQRGLFGLMLEKGMKLEQECMVV